MFWYAFLGDHTTTQSGSTFRYFLRENFSSLSSIPQASGWVRHYLPTRIRDSLHGMYKPGIIRNLSCNNITNKTTSADNLLSLYNKIPDYAEIKHLKQSDFVRAVETLKEEFRRVRSSLYSSNSNEDEEDENLGCRTKDLATQDSASFDPTSNFLKVEGRQSQLLHRSPSSSSYAINYLNYNKPSRSLSFNFDSREKERQDYSSDDDDEENEEVKEASGEHTHTPNSESSNFSKDSSPDFGSYVFHGFKEYHPPNNVEKRLLERKAQYNSAPTLFLNGEAVPQNPDQNQDTHLFKAHPVPSHVYKPLFDFIMLKNQRRSQKVREQSKQKLMAQVKPFTFGNKPAVSYPHPQHKSLTNPERALIQSSHPVSASTRQKEKDGQLLNNAKPTKSSRRCASHHTNNIRMVNHFKASPAPPRTKALLSAMRLKEQQEYRELKKRLRAEALLKNATLPPSMAARDKRTKLSNAKLDALIQDYQNSYNSSKDKNNKNRDREQSTDEDNTFTDEDRLSEDSFRYVDGTPNNTCNSGDGSADTRKKKNFTPYGKSRHSSAASGIFECTSNDNLASRLRIQSTRRKEADRIKREEEELLKLLRNEGRRKKLRDSHLSAWRRAHSYSSSQDIAMRRQLRAAASILERESFVKDMSSMLSRVRSAPLLLEGVRERRYEPCKKHKEEFLNLGDRSVSNNKARTPRFSPRKNWFLDRYGFGDDEPSRSETVALAEGSLTNTDNESDYDDENVDNEKDNQNYDLVGGSEQVDGADKVRDKSETSTPRPQSRSQKKHVRVSLADCKGASN